MMELELTPEQEQKIHDEYGEPADLLGRDAPYFNIPAQVFITVDDRATLETGKVEGDEALAMNHLIHCLLNEGITPTEMQQALQIVRNLDEARDRLDGLLDVTSD